MTRLDAAAFTSAGPRVTGNEDAVLIAGRGGIGIYGVFDGMGGRPRGEVAAAEARRVFAERLVGPPDPGRLAAACLEVNEALLTRSRDEGLVQSMACVGTVAWAEAGEDRARVLVAHLGDTRALCLSADGSGAQLTRDHASVDSEALPEADSLAAPDRHLVAAGYGLETWNGSDSFPVEIREHAVAAGQTLVLVTDGITDFVDRVSLASIRKATPGPAPVFMRAVVDAAEKAQLAAPKGDNLGIVVVRVEPGADPPAVRRGSRERSVALAGLVAAVLALALGFGSRPRTGDGPGEPVPVSSPAARALSAACVAEPGRCGGTAPVAMRVVGARLDLGGVWPAGTFDGLDQRIEAVASAQVSVPPGQVTAWRGLRIAAPEDVRIEIGAGSTLILADLTWNQPDADLQIGLDAGANLVFDHARLRSGGLAIVFGEGSAVRLDGVTLVNGGSAPLFDLEAPPETHPPRLTLADVDLDLGDAALFGESRGAESLPVSLEVLESARLRFTAGEAGWRRPEARGWTDVREAGVTVEVAEP